MSERPSACASPAAHVMELDAERIALLRTLRKGALLPQLLRSLLDQTPGQLGAMDAAVAAGDIATLGMVAHTLKSSSQSIGANRFGELCAAVEAAARSNDGAAATRHWGLLADAWARVRGEVQAQLAA